MGAMELHLLFPAAALLMRAVVVVEQTEILPHIQELVVLAAQAVVVLAQALLVQ